MTASSAGNVCLHAARLEHGLASQQAFADALVAAGRRAGLGEVSLSTRTVRRGEAEEPSWPPSSTRPDPVNDHQQGHPLEALLDVAAPVSSSGPLDQEIGAQ